MLEHYSIPFLDQMIAMVTAAAIITYVIYAVDSPLVGSKMLATAPSVLYGIFRYLYLIYDRRDTRSTAAILTEDPGMIFAGGHLGRRGAGGALRVRLAGFRAVDLTLTPEEEAFRDEVRAWLEENHPGPGADRAATRSSSSSSASGSASCTPPAGPGSRGRRSTAAAARP